MLSPEQVIAELTAPGARFEIATEEVRGHRMPVFANRHRNLADLLADSARFGDVEYLVSNGPEAQRLTFTEHLEQVAALAAALRDEYGVGPGDRVALYSANRPEWIVGFWAAISLGAIAVGANSMWVGPETQYGMDLVDPKVVIADGPRADRLATLEGFDRPVLRVESDLPRLIEKYRGAELSHVEVNEDDAAIILFTSGTSGRPKGATHSHRNVLAALWFHLYNDGLMEKFGVNANGRRFLLTSPLFHIASLHNLAIPRLAVGDTAVIPTGRFDIDAILQLIQDEKVTNWGAVPTMLNRLVEVEVDRYDLSSLVSLSVSSAPSSPTMREKLRALLPYAAPAFSTSYGMTETSTAVTVATGPQLLADPETVGNPVLNMQVEVRDSEDQPVAEGEEGEIAVRGPQVMLGYWNDEGATAASMAPGGWMRTGDWGVMVAGQLSMRSRRSDLILRGGENIYPAEVEDALTDHPAVAEALVMGVPDEDFGQVVGAVVVLRDGEDADEAALSAWAGERLSRYKVPTVWTISREPLPRNATGKVMRAKVAMPGSE